MRIYFLSYQLNFQILSFFFSFVLIVKRNPLYPLKPLQFWSIPLFSLSCQVYFWLKNSKGSYKASFPELTIIANGRVLYAKLCIYPFKLVFGLFIFDQSLSFCCRVNFMSYLKTARVFTKLPFHYCKWQGIKLFIYPFKLVCVWFILY